MVSTEAPPIRADAITTLDSFRNHNKTITLIALPVFLSSLTRFFSRENAHNLRQTAPRTGEVHLHRGYRSVLHLCDLRYREVAHVEEIENESLGLGQTLESRLQQFNLSISIQIEFEFR